MAIVGLRIFLVEDNEADVVLVREAFARAGAECEMLVAEDGHQALTMIEQIDRDLLHPDVAIIDLNIPKVNGSEVLEALRLCSASKELPAVVMTSSRHPADLETINRMGAAYFHKPIDVGEYFKIVEVVTALVREQAKASGA